MGFYTLKKANIMAKYKHDCKKCVFLETHKDHDLYFHSGERQTVVARYGDDGADYISGLEFVNHDENIKRAYLLALLSGLM